MHTLALLLSLAAQDISLVTQEGHAPVRGFAFSPDGQYLATAGNQTAKLYRRDGVLLRTLGPNGGEVHSVAFSPDASTLAVGTKHGVVLWSLSGDKLRTLEAVRTCSCATVAFASKGRQVVCASKHSGLFVWTLQGKLQWRFEKARQVMALSPDARTIFVTNKDESIVKLRLRDGRVLSTTKRASPYAKVTEMAFVGRDLVTVQHGASAEALQLRDSKARVKRVLFKPAGRGKSGGVFGLHAHPKGPRYAIFDSRHSKGAKDPRARQSQYRDWLLQGTKRGVRGKAHPVGEAIRTGTMGGSRITQAAWFRGGADRLVLAEGVLYRMDDKGAVQRAFGSPAENVRSARARAGGGWVVAHEHGVSVWSASGRMQAQWPVKVGPVADIGVTHDDKYVVTTGVYGWEVRTLAGALLRSAITNSANLTKLYGLSPDGRFMALGAPQRAGAVQPILQTKEPQRHGTGSQVAFLPGGGYLTSNKVPSTQPAWKVHKYNVTHYDGTGTRTAVGTGLDHALVYPNVPKFTSWSGQNLRIHAPDGKVTHTLRRHPKGQLMLTPDGERVITLFNSEITVHEMSGRLLRRFSVDEAPKNPSEDQRGPGSDYRQVSPDGEHFKLFGQVWSLTTGKRLVSRTKAYGESYVFGGPGQLLKSRHNAPDLEVHNFGTGKTVHLLATGGQWVSYTPDGFYDASPAGGRRVMMVRGLEAFAVDQFAPRINRPDIILERLGAGPEAAIEHYRHLYERRLKKLGLSPELLDLHAPDAQIVSAKVRGRRLDIKAACADSQYDLRRYNIYVNDVPLFAGGKAIKGRHAKMRDKIELTEGTNRVEVSCTNDREVESFRAVRTFESKKKDVGSLWVLAFGVSDYQDDRLDLQFAHKDALDISDTLARATGFSKIHVHTFTDKEVTAQAIQGAKALLSKSGPADTLVVFIAGHGLHERDQDATWYYLTHDTKLDNLASSAARFEDVEALLHGVAPRKKLFLMDACESGEADGVAATATPSADSAVAPRGIRRKAKGAEVAAEAKATERRPWLFETDRFIYNDLARRSGAIVFSSSRGGELSYESSKLKNGFFTYYLLQALSSAKADANSDGSVSTRELRSYVGAAVSEASHGRQHPTVDRDNLFMQFGFRIPRSR